MIDLIVSDEAGRLEDAERFVARPGGAPANVTVALARLGVASAFGGVVGDDPFGRRLRDGLAAEGVDVSRLRSTAGAATTLAFAWKDRRGDGHFWLLRGADLALTAADAVAWIDNQAALVVGSVALAGEPSRSAIQAAVARAGQRGVPVCFDVNLRPTLWPELEIARRACAPILERATLIKLSLDDAKHLFATGDDPVATVEAVRAARRDDVEVSRGDRLVVLTDGDRGCWWAPVEGHAPVRHVPAFAVAAVEPTGAGDAFTAGLLARLLARGWTAPDEADLRYAAAAGALATTRPGAWDGLPHRDHLERFLAERT